MASGFSVQGIQVEGFKGFASSTDIEFNGRHVFLLGENGNGKSSIVEAVRWGLFGSAYRPNEIVKNQHYPGDCRVTVKLMRDGRLWNLSRTLSLGTDRTSEPTLTDQDGERHPIRKIMPQLDSVDTGEGTHIIFAPQSAPLRRQPEDLEPFERTVFNYLGLTRPRALLSSINTFLEEQTDAEHTLDKELDEARSNIDDQVAQQETIRTSILSAAPWGNALAPSRASSEQKVRGFIQDVAHELPGEKLESLTLDALLEAAEASLNKRLSEGEAVLETQVDELTRFRGHLEDLREIRSQIRIHESTIVCTQTTLKSLYNGLALDELRENLEKAQYTATTESLREKIARDALHFIDRHASLEVSCPICDSRHDRNILAAALNGIASQRDQPITSTVAVLQSQIDRADALEQQLIEQKQQLKILSNNADSAITLVADQDKSKLASSGDIDQMITDYSERESFVRAQIDDHETWHASARAKLNRLEDEVRFHQIQRRLSDLQEHRGQLERAIESYGALVKYGQSVRTIRDTVDSQLSEQLAEDLPLVSETLSKAFSALTKHPWYDRLVLVQSSNAKLEMRVASSQDPTGREDPTGVLNGQAESALDLVPYFAFSQTDGTPTEVYLVMLDDPTRALDIQHIVILLDELRELGRNVQLIVASQETERFQEMLPSVFDADSFVIIEPTGWSPERGPNLEYR